MTTKERKHSAPPRYDEAFKAGAIRMVTEQGRPSREVAKELGICSDTLRNWLKAAGTPSPGQVDRQNREAKRLRKLEAENRALRKKLEEKEEVIDVLKNPLAYFQSHRREIPVHPYWGGLSGGASVELLCRLLEISRSGYYAWIHRKDSPCKQHDQTIKCQLLYSAANPNLA